MSLNDRCDRNLRAITCDLVCVLLAGPVAHAADRVAFDFTIVDQPGQGFNDPVIGPQRLAAVKHAANLWSQMLVSSYSGETLHVDLSMDLTGNNLAAAFNLYVWNGVQGGIASTVYGSALTNHLVGRDLDASKQEFTMRFSPIAPWYYGTDGNPAANQYDLVTVAMHEIAHGLGFNSRLGLGNGNYEPIDLPGVYDRFLIRGADGPIPIPELTLVERAASLTGGDLYWYGTNAVAANGGVRPKIFAPPVFAAGHSLTHLDPTTFPNALMRGSSANATKLGEVIRPSLVELAMLTDMGWDIIPVPEPSSMVLLLACFTCLAVKCRPNKLQHAG